MILMLRHFTGLLMLVLAAVAATGPLFFIVFSLAGAQVRTTLIWLFINILAVLVLYRAGMRLVRRA